MRALVTAVLSAVVCATTVSSAWADVVAPESVRKQRISPTEIRVTWNDVTPDEDGFEILRRDITEPEFQTRGTVGPNVTEFIDEAPRDAIFIYHVRSFRDDELSELSNQCYVNRPGPPVPLSFSARLISLHVARIGWSDRSAGERGFEIQRAPLGTTRWKTIARVESNLETYDDYTLSPATSYSYRMRALGRPAICWPDGPFTPTRSITTKGGVRILEVDLRGKGKGKVTSLPAGISCGPHDDHCAAEFSVTAFVTLTAKPNRTSRFAGWYEYPQCQDEDGPCEVYMNEKNQLIGAFFRRN